MKIKIRVIPRASRNTITADENGDLRVYTTVAPTDGKANEAVIKMMADFLKVPKSAIKIVRGNTTRDKVIEV